MPTTHFFCHGLNFEHQNLLYQLYHKPFFLQILSYNESQDMQKFVMNIKIKINNNDELKKKIDKRKKQCICIVAHFVLWKIIYKLINDGLLLLHLIKRMFRIKLNRIHINVIFRTHPTCFIYSYMSEFTCLSKQSTKPTTKG